MKDLPKNHFGAILADPPWRFERRYTRDPYKHKYRSADYYYNTMSIDQICELTVSELSAKNCVLFMWVAWPFLEYSFRIISAWGFEYKTCAFAWMKADQTQIKLFQDDTWPHMLMGYWTRANSEVCLLATKGKPKRLNADVRQGIIAPRREHSRKPDGIHERIERLVAGPYLELFARQERKGWTCWGNQTKKFGIVAFEMKIMTKKEIFNRIRFLRIYDCRADCNSTREELAELNQRLDWFTLAPKYRTKAMLKKMILDAKNLGASHDRSS